MFKNHIKNYGASQHMGSKFNKFAKRHAKGYKRFVNSIVERQIGAFITNMEHGDELAESLYRSFVWQNFKSLMESAGLIRESAEDGRIYFGNAKNVEFISHIVENAVKKAYGKICQMSYSKPDQSELSEMMENVSRNCMLHILHNA